MMPPKIPATTTLRNASRNAVRGGNVGGRRSGSSSSPGARSGFGVGASSTDSMLTGTTCAPAMQASHLASAGMRALVVLPTYNEIENIETVLRQVRAALPDDAVLVVDDGSPDGTAERAESLDAELGCITVLRRPAKAGLGSAYRAGFRRGLDEGFDVLVEMDADLSHDPAVLPALVGAVAGGADLAIGSRYVPGGSIPDWPFLRRAMSRIGCWYARTMLGLSVHDATAGFRAYRAEALREIDLEAVRADGYGF